MFSHLHLFKSTNLKARERKSQQSKRRKLFFNFKLLFNHCNVTITLFCLALGKHSNFALIKILTCHWSRTFTSIALKAPVCNQMSVQVQLTLVFPIITFYSDRLRQRHIRKVHSMTSWIGVNAFGFLSITKNRQDKAGMWGHVHCTPEQGVVGTSEVEGHVCQEDGQKHKTESFMAHALSEMSVFSQQITTPTTCTTTFIVVIVKMVIVIINVITCMD